MAMNVDMTGGTNAPGTIRSTDRPNIAELVGLFSGIRDVLSRLEVRLDTLTGILTHQKNSNLSFNQSVFLSNRAQNFSNSRGYGPTPSESRTAERRSTRLDGANLKQIGRQPLAQLADGAVSIKLDPLQQGKIRPEQTGQQENNTSASLQGNINFSGSVLTGSAGELAQLEQEGGKLNISERKSRANQSNAPAGFSSPTAGIMLKSSASTSQSEAYTQGPNLGYQSGVRQNTKQQARADASQMTRSVIRTPFNFGSKPSQQSEAVQFEMEGVKQHRFNEMMLQTTDRKNKKPNLALSGALENKQREDVQAQLEGVKLARMNELKARKKKGLFGGDYGVAGVAEQKNNQYSESDDSGYSSVGFSAPSSQPRQITLSYTPFDPTFVGDSLEQTFVLQGASRQAMSLVNSESGSSSTTEPVFTEPQPIADVLGLIEQLLNEYCNSITDRAEEMGDRIQEMSAAVGELNEIWGEIMIIAIAATDSTDMDITFNMLNHAEIGPLLDEISALSQTLTEEDFEEVLQFSDASVDYLQVQQYNANVVAYCDTVQVEIDSLTNDFEQLMSQISSIEEELRNLHSFNTAFARR